MAWRVLVAAIVSLCSVTVMAEPRKKEVVCSCPQYPIEELDDGVWSFYIERYEDPCYDMSSVVDPLPEDTAYPQSCTGSDCSCFGWGPLDDATTRLLEENDCLLGKKQISFVPRLVRGATVLQERFIRFTTPDDRTVDAKVFLVELDFTLFPYDQFPRVDRQALRQMGRRMHGIGYEIDVSNNWEPELIIDKAFVRQESEESACDFFVTVGGSQIYHVKTAMHRHPNTIPQQREPTPAGRTD